MGEEIGRLRVRVNSSMDRFFSGNIKSRETVGDSYFVAAVSLSKQGFSGRKSGLAKSILIDSFSLFLTRPHGQLGSAGEVDTGLVTFFVYECDEGGKAEKAPAGRVPRRLQADHAGSRVVPNDVMEIRPLRKGQTAGCDAGKGAMELAAGSLAWNGYVRGMHGASAVAACLG